MPTFIYKAKNPNGGKDLKSEIDAATKEDANRTLVKRGLIPTSIKLKSGSSSRFFGRIKTKDKVLFSRQLSTLINAGLPLVQSLRTVSEQTQNAKLQQIINRVTNTVEGGETLSSSLAQFPDNFSSVYVSLVEAGEVSGTLDESLERLANQQEKDAAISSKVKGALVYPAIVLAVIGLVVIFMLTSVLPQVELLYRDLNAELPALTKFLLSVSRFMTNFWWLIIILIILMALALRSYVGTPSGRKWFDSFKMRVPLFGVLFKKLYMARFARTGQTLMGSAVPMLKMLDITQIAVDNVVVASAIDRAAAKVKGGGNLGEALQPETESFLPLVHQMISVGEKSGNVDAMMGKAADYYEAELDNQVKAISTTIEPLLMVVLAVVAGGLVASILLPVYGLVGESVGV